MKRLNPAFALIALLSLILTLVVVFSLAMSAISNPDDTVVQWWRMVAAWVPWGLFWTVIWTAFALQYPLKREPS